MDVEDDKEAIQIGVGIGVGLGTLLFGTLGFYLWYVVRRWSLMALDRVQSFRGGSPRRM